MRVHFAMVPVFGGEVWEEELNRFLATHRVVAIDRQFVSDGPRSAWAVCVSWVTTPGREEGVDAPGKRARVDYRDLFSPEDFAVFAKLRDARKALAERDAVPPYAVFTNEQLAEMVRRKVRTAEAMTRIDGVGPGRIEKYGAVVLGLLQLLPEAAASSPPTPAPPPPAAT